MLQNKLTKPAILLEDGSVIKGPELSEPWQVSDFRTEGKKARETLEEIQNSYEEARRQNKDRITKGAITGFEIDGEFFPSQVIVDRFEIGKKHH